MQPVTTLAARRACQYANSPRRLSISSTLRQPTALRHAIYAPPRRRLCAAPQAAAVSVAATTVAQPATAFGVADATTYASSTVAVALAQLAAALALAAAAVPIAAATLAQPAASLTLAAASLAAVALAAAAVALAAVAIAAAAAIAQPPAVANDVAVPTGLAGQVRVR